MAILFISHKLDEIRALTSRATVLRRGINVDGRYRYTVGLQLAEMMVGETVGDVIRETALLMVTSCWSGHLSRPRPTQFATPLRSISMQARRGEILGIAGIAGNGRDELMEALIGEWRGESNGVMFLDGLDITMQARRHAAIGIGFVPKNAMATPRYR